MQGECGHDRRHATLLDKGQSLASVPCLDSCVPGPAKHCARDETIVVARIKDEHGLHEAPPAAGAGDCSGARPTRPPRCGSAELERERYDSKTQKALEDAVRQFDEAFDAAAKRYDE